VQANEEILTMASLDRELKNMGTTIVLAVWRKGSAIMYIAGLGDSRAYQIRGKRIEHLTIDHSIAQALVEAKTISAAEARTQRQQGPTHPAAPARPSLASAAGWVRYHRNPWTIGVMTSSGTTTCAGSVAMNNTAAATSSGCKMLRRCVSSIALGRTSRMGVFT